ncbi:hypothetical protein [Mesorhizobium sp. M0488]|uniref:hypothetical protein n=1 Tax=unclassified Mesorhizobium TaxID=325217 RepID=UPI0033360ACA
MKHISPLSWEHIHLTGIYTWDSQQHLQEGFRCFASWLGYGAPNKVLAPFYLNL